MGEKNFINTNEANLMKPHINTCRIYVGASSTTIKNYQNVIMLIWSRQCSCLNHIDFSNSNLYINICKFSLLLIVTNSLLSLKNI